MKPSLILSRDFEVFRGSFERLAELAAKERRARKEMGKMAFLRDRGVYLSFIFKVASFSLGSSNPGVPVDEGGIVIMMLEGLCSQYQLRVRR